MVTRRTMTPRSLVLLAALSLCVTIPQGRVSARSDAVEGAHRTAACQSAIDQELFTNPPLVGAPFSADVITVWHPPARPEMRATARYYRDSVGRVRVDQTFVGHTSGPQRVMLKLDTGSKRVYVLDPIARSSTRTGQGIANMLTGAGSCQSYVLPVTSTRSITFSIHGSEIAYPTLVDGEALRPRAIDGVQAAGSRFAMLMPNGVTDQGQGERWVSPELKLVLSSHGENSRIGTIDYQLTRIDRTEPPAHLFALPDDYSVRPDNAFGPSLCWQNPYNVPLWPCQGQGR